MKEQFIVFYNKTTGEELGGYSSRGTLKEEEEATAELLAYENSIDITDVEIKIELR